jgi:DNA-binding MarR family transcriptional regulator
MSGTVNQGGERSGSSGPGRDIANLDLDKVIHERARLVLLTYLSSSDKAEIGFTELRDELGMTGGNLSVQLKTLEEAGYIKIEKRFVENKPYTGVALTARGHKALSDYMGELEVIVASLRGASTRTQSDTRRPNGIGAAKAGSRGEKKGG